MKDYAALDWYFSSPTAISLYNLDRIALRCLGINDDNKIMSIEHLQERVDRDAERLLRHVETIYRRKCDKYYSTKQKQVIRKNSYWSFEYKVIKSRKDHAKYRAARIGVEININENNKPSLLLYLFCPDKKAYSNYAVVVNKINSVKRAKTKAIAVWGKSVGNNYYLLGEVLLKSKTGRFKAQKKIEDDFSLLLQNTLLVRGQYSLMASLDKVARRK